MIFKKNFFRNIFVLKGKKAIFLFLIIFCLSGCSFRAEVAPEIIKELNIYNWDDYFGETTIEDFENRFGIKVNLYTFEDENFMISDVQANPDKYDLIVVSDSLVYKMKELKILSKIEKEVITNLSNIDDGFLGQWYDPNNDYSIPYLWGTTGIIFNTKYIKESIDSWSALFNEKYKNKIVMLNNSEEVIGAALKSLKYPLLADDLEQLNEVRDIVLKQKEIVNGYNTPVEIREAMISGDIWIAQLYSGEALYAIDQNEDLRYVIPKEGAPVWVDSFAIPYDAKNKEAAEKFINFVLEPKVSGDIANYLWYANTNKAARDFTHEEILNDEGLYPSDDVLKKLEFFKFNKLNNEYNRLWSELLLK